MSLAQDMGRHANPESTDYYVDAGERNSNANHLVNILGFGDKVRACDQSRRPNEKGGSL